MYRLKEQYSQKECLSTRFHETGEANPRIAAPKFIPDREAQGGKEKQKKKKGETRPPQERRKKAKTA